jgi:L-fuconolactonase
VPDASPAPIVVDSHHHVWDPAKRDYPWMKGIDALERPFTVDDLRPLLQENGVNATVLVQTVSDITETHEFLKLAAETDFIAGVVGWVDLLDPGIATTLADLNASPEGRYLVGIRHQIHDEADPDWALQEQVQHGFEAIAEAGLVYDLLVRPRELPTAVTVARDFSHLHFVIDHIAKPSIATGEIDDWAAQMREFAALGNVVCKLSGMVSEVNPASWSTENLKPYVNTVLEIFGPDRLMFGSDWPVCTVVASYSEVMMTLRTVLDELGVTDPEAIANIFGRTAAHWYGLERNLSEMPGELT